VRRLRLAPKPSETAEQPDVVSQLLTIGDQLEAATKALRQLVAELRSEMSPDEDETSTGR
jgi:hypothetical protein